MSEHFDEEKELRDRLSGLGLLPRIIDDIEKIVGEIIEEHDEKLRDALYEISPD